VTGKQVAVGTSDAATEASLTYTSNGKLGTLKDAENNLTTYEYDGHDRLSKTRYPLPTQGSNASSTTDYEQLAYDANSNVTSRRLRDAQSIAFTYDNLDRPTLKDLPSSEPDVTYAYDNLSRLTGASQTGNALSFTYDALSRNLTQVGPLGTVASQWDVAGRRTRLTYPGSGLYVDYDYLVTGETIKIRENGATSGVGVLATYAYDNLGRRSSLTFGNGVSQGYTFDPVSRLASLTNELSGTTNDLSETFAYNPASQIASTTRTGDAYAWTGHFNTNVTGTANGLNQLTSVGAKNLTHDPRGNVTAFGTKSFTYSSENLLLTGPGSTTLGYDPAMRLYQSVSGGTTRFAYDGLDRIAEYDASNALQRRYVHGPNMDEPLVQYEGTGTSDRRFMSSDERGSIISLTDSSGTLLGLNRYDEYGNPQPTNIGAFGYTGQAWLPGVNLWYYKARHYDPELGRFLQTDPIDVEGGINLYAYVGNDPINWSDPLGLMSRAECERKGYVCGRRLPKPDLSALAPPLPEGPTEGPLDPPEGPGSTSTPESEARKKFCEGLDKDVKNAQSALSGFMTKFPVWNNAEGLKGELSWIQGDLAQLNSVRDTIEDLSDAAKIVGPAWSMATKRLLGGTIGLVSVIGSRNLDARIDALTRQVAAINARIRQLQAIESGVCK
jgi:RHS repeat-associated protein